VSKEKKIAVLFVSNSSQVVNESSIKDEVTGFWCIKIEVLCFSWVRPFANMLGDWLKLLLEWDPEVRGRERKDGPLLVYSRLEKLLSTKVRR
jgi:hypothetical protein